MKYFFYCNVTLPVYFCWKCIMLSSPSIYGSVWQLLDVICIFCVFIIFVSKEVKPTRFSWTKPTSLVSYPFLPRELRFSPWWWFRVVVIEVGLIVRVLRSLYFTARASMGLLPRALCKEQQRRYNGFTKKSNFNAVRAVCLLGRVIEFNNKKSSCWKQILQTEPSTCV